MERVEYDAMAREEGTYWWHRCMRAVLADALARLELPPDARVLDAGCGTGRTVEELSPRFPFRFHGVDISSVAALRWPEVLRSRACLGSVSRLPFAADTFDAVYAADVLNAAEVEPEAAASELWRVLRPRGALVLWLPAYPWLLSAHDRAVHGARRFTRASARRLLEHDPARPWTIGRQTYLYPTFFPLIATMKLLRRSGGAEAGSDVRPLPRPVNAILSALGDVERRGLRWLDYPFGTTILTVARKAA